MNPVRELVREVAPNTHRAPELDRSAAIADAVAPGSVIFERNWTQVDGAFRKIYMLRNFRTLNHAMWLDRLLNQDRTVSTIIVKPSDSERVVKAIDRTDARSGVFLAAGNSSASRAIEHEINRDHARTMLSLIADEQKSMVDCQFLFQTDFDSEGELADGYRRLCKAASPLTLSECPASQRQAFLLANPLSPKTDDYLTPQFEISMPVDTLAATMPFSSTGILDATGTVLGTDSSGSTVRVDMLAQTSERSNMNGTITGTSGAGKSHALKKIARSEYIERGARVIAIDPEGELVREAKELFGQVVAVGGGRRTTTSAMISPLQPRAVSFDYDGDDDDAPVDVLRSTVSFLRGFYQLAFGVTERELASLDKGLVEAYRRHGLTYDTPYQEIDFNDYPTMDELAGVFRELADGAKRPEQAQVFDFLADQTETGGEEGLYGNLWSGRTNIDLKSDLIVFDLHGLDGGNVSSSVKNAQMYSVLSFLWGEVCKSRVTGRSLRIIIDEGHMLFGTKDGAGDFRAAPIAASFTCMLMKRARKYNAGVLFATQQLSDMLHEDIVRYGEAVFAMSAYHFTFATEKVEHAGLVKLCGMSPSLAEALKDFGRGECIFEAGSEAIHLHVGKIPVLPDDARTEGAW